MSEASAIWVDADACPRPVKEMLYRAAQRTGVAVTLVANQPLAVPRLASVRVLTVGSGFDVADDAIVERVRHGDLVVTADIPLAAAVLERGARAVTPRGAPFSPDTIRAQLTMRDFMATMRAGGAQTGGPPALSAADRNAFAAQLDRWLVGRQELARPVARRR